MRALTMEEWAAEAGCSIAAVSVKLKKGVIKRLEGQQKVMIDADEFTPQKLKRGPQKGSKYKERRKVENSQEIKEGVI